MPVRFLSPAHYQAYGHYTGCPSPAQLSQYFYLDDFDRHHIAQRRRSRNRLGFAIQLVSLRFLGTYLNHLNQVPAEVTTYVAQQITLDVSPTDQALYSRSATFWDHQIDLNRIYGYHWFHEVRPSFQFLRWLYARAWVGSERPSVLFDLATAWLIEHKILLPGVTSLERLVARVCERAEQRS